MAIPARKFSRLQCADRVSLTLIITSYLSIFGGDSDNFPEVKLKFTSAMKK